jgi:hypothetical protein
MMQLSPVPWGFRPIKEVILARRYPYPSNLRNQGVDPMPLFTADGIQIRVACASLQAAKGHSSSTSAASNPSLNPPEHQATRASTHLIGLPVGLSCKVLSFFKIDELFLKGQRANNM